MGGAAGGDGRRAGPPRRTAALRGDRQRRRRVLARRRRDGRRPSGAAATPIAAAAAAQRAFACGAVAAGAAGAHGGAHRRGRGARRRLLRPGAEPGGAAHGDSPPAGRSWCRWPRPRWCATDCRSGCGLVELGERSLRSLSTTRARVRADVGGWVRRRSVVEVGVLGPLRPRRRRRRRRGARTEAAGPARAPGHGVAGPDERRQPDAGHVARRAWRRRVPPPCRATSPGLRRHLGAAGSRLENVPGGYRLRLEPGELDAASASPCCSIGLASGGVHRRCRRLGHRARGPPPVAGRAARGVRRRGRAGGWRQSLDEQRLAAADLHAQLAVATDELPGGGRRRRRRRVRGRDCAKQRAAVHAGTRGRGPGGGGAAGRPRLPPACWPNRQASQPSATLSALEHTIAVGAEGAGRSTDPRVATRGHDGS